MAEPSRMGFHVCWRRRGRPVIDRVFSVRGNSNSCFHLLKVAFSAHVIVAMHLRAVVVSLDFLMAQWNPRSGVTVTSAIGKDLLTSAG